MNIEQLQIDHRIVHRLLEEVGPIDEAKVQDPLVVATLLMAYKMHEGALDMIKGIVASMREMNIIDLRATELLDQLDEVIKLATPQAPVLQAT